MAVAEVEPWAQPSVQMLLRGNGDKHLESIPAKPSKHLIENENAALSAVNPLRTMSRIDFQETALLAPQDQSIRC